MDKIFYFIKFIHICFVIFLMAGLLYLPRLFVYHSTLEKNCSSYALFEKMERRLINIIIYPSWFFVALTGFFLASYHHNSFFFQIWFLIKLIFVVFLIFFYIFCIFFYLSFKRKKNILTDKFYRTINEIPGIILIVIVYLVIMKPFS